MSGNFGLLVITLEASLTEAQHSSLARWYLHSNTARLSLSLSSSPTSVHTEEFVVSISKQILTGPSGGTWTVSKNLAQLKPQSVKFPAYISENSEWILVFTLQVWTKAGEQTTGTTGLETCSNENVEKYCKYHPELNCPLLFGEAAVRISLDFTGL